MPPSDHFSIERVAQLARIDLSESDTVQLQTQISNILEFINVLDELDLSEVQPFFGLDFASHNEELSPQRNDDVTPSITRDSILENAPNQNEEFYRVPPVF